MEFWQTQAGAHVSRRYPRRPHRRKGHNLYLKTMAWFLREARVVFINPPLTAPRVKPSRERDAQRWRHPLRTRVLHCARESGLVWYGERETCWPGCVRVLPGFSRTLQLWEESDDRLWSVHGYHQSLQISETVDRKWYGWWGPKSPIVLLITKMWYINLDR